LNALAPTYAFWQNALAGRPQPVHDGDPQPGFYYQRRKDGPRLPVAIWFSDAGDPLALVGFEGTAKLGNAAEIWTWVCQYPVTEEIYRAAFAAGAWPDDPPPARGSVPGDNLPEDPAEALAAELAGEEDTAAPFLAKPIETKQDADRVSVWAKRLTTLGARAVDLHKIEKQPHLEAGKAVDAKWFPIRDGAKDLASRLKEHLQPYLLKQQREEARRAAEAAAEEVRLREEAARVAEMDDDRAADRAAELERQADVAAKMSAPKNASAGRTGARVALRPVYVAVITDYAACYAALSAHPDMQNFVQQLADRACRAKVPLAGVEFRSEQKAV
jgi:hypothetical protein